MWEFDYRLWTVIILSTFLRWLLSEAVTRKKAIGSALSGIMAAYYGHDAVISSFDMFGEPARIPIVITLVLVGETLARAVLLITPESLLALVTKKGKQND